MKRKTLIILIAAALLSLFTVFNYLNASRINPTDFNVKYLDLTDDRIPKSFDGCTILFISDIEYGNFFNKERLAEFAKTLETLQPDIMIFGGDMFDTIYAPLTEDVELLIQTLSIIAAPYGKFAILGDFDQISEQRAALVRKVLNDAEFELLDANPLTIHYGSGDHINLVGINYQDEISDLSGRFSTIDSGLFTLTVVHGAEFAKNLPLQVSTVTLSGHSHHSQINLPFFINHEKYKHTGKLGVGRFSLSNTLLYVSRGIGTTSSDYRFFCDPELMYFRIKK